MVIAELLELVGVEAAMVLLVSGVVGVYHLHTGMKVIGRVRTWIMATALFSLVLLAGEAGLIPGIDPQLGELFSWIIDSISAGVTTLVDAITGVLP